MSPRNVWPSVTLAIAAMLIIAGMAIAKVNQETIMWIATVLALPVLGALLAAQGAAHNQGLQQLQIQTNGNQARMLDIVDRLGHLLAAAAPVPADPSTTTGPAEPPAIEKG